MQPLKHLAVSSIAGGVVWAATGEPLALPVAAAAGTLMDGDHIPDVWWNFVLRRTPVVTYLAHAWEWTGVLLVLGIWLGFSWWLMAVIAGHGLHVIADHLFNRRRSNWVYSLAYRARHRFLATRLVDSWDYGFDPAHEASRLAWPLAWRLADWCYNYRTTRRLR